ncbi:hypothetical protein MIR68_010182 [Amoeboaphelidium protococcarum]|nr:hypothetical protein MIR68_010182 [Amoeboaphelidium protococcarum]
MFSFGGNQQNTTAQQQQQQLQQQQPYQQTAFGAGQTGGGGGLFSFGGNNTNNNNQQQQQPQPQQQQTSTSGPFQFGFGQPPQQQQQQQPAQQQNNFQFGSNQQQQQQPQNAQQNQQNMQQPQQTSAEQQQSELIWSQLEEINASYDVNSHKYKFRHAFYNMVQKGQVGMYQKPNNIPDGMWSDALQSSPDPSCMVPVFAQSFEDLQKRVDSQHKQLSQFKSKMQEVIADIGLLSDKKSMQVEPKMTQVRTNQQKLQIKLLKCLKHIQLLANKDQSSLSRNEEELARQLNQLNDQVQSQSFTGLVQDLKSKFNLLSSVPNYYQQSHQNQLSNISSVSGFEVLDEQQIVEMLNSLGEMQKCLEHLTNVLNEDTRLCSSLEKNMALDSGKNRF